MGYVFDINSTEPGTGALAMNNQKSKTRILQKPSQKCKPRIHNAKVIPRYIVKKDENEIRRDD